MKKNIYTVFVLQCILLMALPLLAKGMSGVPLPRNYDKAHPYYIKFCPATQWIPKESEESAGVPTGHTVFYLKGVCLKQIKNELPKIFLCDEEKNDLSNPETGVGFSTDGALKNSIYSMIPGLTPLLSAGIGNDEILTEERKAAVVEDYTEKGYFDGLELGEKWLDPASKISYKKLEDDVSKAKESGSVQELEEAYKKRSHFIGHWIFGTGIGLNMARYMFCLNIPLSREMMGKVVNHLIEDNESLKSSKGLPWRGKIKTENEYVWDPIHNNCNHTGHNAVAATGAISPIPVDLPLWRQIFHLAIPGGSLLKMTKELIESDLNPHSIYNNREQRENFLETNWLPISHDTLVEMIPFHQKNKVYKDSALDSASGDPYMSVKLIPTLIAKFFKKHKKFSSKIDSGTKDVMALPRNQMMSNHEEVGLTEHYHYFKFKYEKALAQIEAIKNSSSYKRIEKIVKMSEKEASTALYGDESDEQLIEKTSKDVENREYLEFMIKFEKKIKSSLEEVNRKLGKSNLEE